MVYLRVSDEIVVSRLSGRLICRACQTPFHTRLNPPRVAGICDCCGKTLYHRSDDSPEMALRRLRVFHRSTGPLLERYAAEGKLIVVSGDGTVAEVGERLVAALDGVSIGRGSFLAREKFGELFTVEAAPTPPPAIGLDLILLGGPGSGKGTQAELLATKLKLPHISTGDLFRENLRQATELGKLAKGYMDRGELVPDDVTDHMVEERLGRTDVRDGFILDGYPRTLAQAVALDEILARLGRRITGALNIDVPDSSIVERLSGRLICRSCQAPFHVRFHPPKVQGVCDHCGGELYRRSDDNPATIRTRLATFHRQAEPLIHYYRDCGVLRDIAGNDAVEGSPMTTRAEKLMFLPPFTTLVTRLMATTCSFRFRLAGSMRFAMIAIKTPVPRRAPLRPGPSCGRDIDTRRGRTPPCLMPFSLARSATSLPIALAAATFPPLVFAALIHGGCRYQRFRPRRRR